MVKEGKFIVVAAQDLPKTSLPSHHTVIGKYRKLEFVHRATSHLHAEARKRRYREIGVYQGDRLVATL
jgi:hypothetical protein